MHPKPIPIDRFKQISQFIAHENGLDPSKTNTLDRRKQTSQYIAHENGFGCIQNQSLDRCEQISRFIAHVREWFWMHPKPIP
jgi:hypothetical protein